MALTNSNVTMTFTGYEIGDGGIHMTFSAANPGPGQPSDYTIFITDDQLAQITTQVQLRNLCQTELNRKLRGTNISSKLDPLIGQTLVV